MCERKTIWEGWDPWNFHRMENGGAIWISIIFHIRLVFGENIGIYGVWCSFDYNFPNCQTENSFFIQSCRSLHEEYLLGRIHIWDVKVLSEKGTNQILWMWRETNPCQDMQRGRGRGGTSKGSSVEFVKQLYSLGICAYPVSMVQWKTTPNERKRSYWRYAHFSLNHDYGRKG